MTKVKIDQIQETLKQNGDVTLVVLDANGKQTHVIFPIDEARHLYQEYVRRELQVAHEQSLRGESQPLDVEAIKAELGEEVDEYGRTR